MFNHKLLLFIVICVIIYIMFFIKTDKKEHFIDGIKLIVTKDDAINYLSTIVKNNNNEPNLSLDDAKLLYENLFEDNTEMDKKIYEIFNSLPFLSKNNSPVNDNIYYNKTYLAICDIINNYGIYNNLPWFGNNVLTINNLKIMTKERLQQIYKFNPNNSINFITFFDKLSNNYYLSCDIVDIIKFNKFYTTLDQIIVRHPVLNAYQTKIYEIYGNEIKSMTKLEFIKSGNYDANNLSKLFPNNGDESFIDLIKQSIINTLFTTYDNDMTIDKLFNLSQFVHDKNNFTNALISSLNEITLNITPNYDYSDETNKSNLLSGTIGRINETILNIRYNKDLNYLRNNLWETDENNKPIIVDSKKVPLVQDSVMVDILNILYKYYINIPDVSKDSIATIIKNIKNENITFPSLDDELNYIINNINDLMLDQMLSSSNTIINCNNISHFMQHIRALIKVNHNDIPYNIINNNVNKYIKIGTLSKMLFFGIY
jgi:hypothetical protein